MDKTWSKWFRNHHYDMVKIAAVALRDDPDNQIVQTWLKVPKPNVTEAAPLIKVLAGRFHNHDRLCTLLIRAGDTPSYIHEGLTPTEFLERIYQQWFENAEDVVVGKHMRRADYLNLLDEPIPESQIREMAEKYPRREQVIKLCQKAGMPTDSIPPCWDRYSPEDIWYTIWFDSSEGWVVQYDRLVEAARRPF